MFTAGAIITFLFGLAYLIDGCSDLANGKPYGRIMAAAAVMLAMFAVFYAARAWGP